MTVFGSDYPTPDGTAIRDYVHVSDLADAHVRALSYLWDNEKSVVCNLGTGCGSSVQEVVETVGQIAGRAVPMTRGPRRDGDPPCTGLGQRQGSGTPRLDSEALGDRYNRRRRLELAQPGRSEAS